MSNKRVVSGIRPTGNVHLGNYLGAIRNSVALQDAHQGFFFIADLHAVTEEYDAKLLAEHTCATAAIYLASGIDATRSTLFVQSHVPAHCGLARVLGSIAPFGLLSRMVQFKDKSERQGAKTCLGLFDYPVLMAADILAYKPELVPVGSDQKQHLELTQQLANRFNKRFGPVFVVPKPLIMQDGARIMSLSDGNSKMSKSEPNDRSRINLLDGADAVKAKVHFAKTDLIKGLEFGNRDRPEVNNLLTIYQLASGKSREHVATECGDMGYGKFKPLLTDALVSYLEPIQTRFARIMGDRAELDAILKQGAERAGVIAEETLKQAMSAMGFAGRT